MSDLLEFLRTHEEAFRSRNRLQSLYSDFRLQKTSNPDNYQANSSAWLRGLTVAARAGLLPLRQTKAASAHPSHLAFTSGDELAAALQTQQYGRPPALDAVVQDAVAKGDLVPLSDFLQAQKSIYSKSWLPSPWQAVSWGMKQIGISGLLGGNRLAVGNFVVLANVEEAANAIARQASQNSDSLTSRIYSRDLFTKTFANALADSPSMTLSQTDISILLTYLARDKPLLSFSPSTGTIKFKAANESHPTPITPEDTHIASLRTLITTLTDQTDTLTSKVASLDADVRAAVAAKNTLRAKSLLRTKKLAENTLAQRLATLAQLEDVYASIEQASDQVAIVHVMQSSAGVLRALHNQVGGVEGVEGVVDALRDEMDKAEEVGRIIDEGNAGREGVDEDQVEHELRELERAERVKDEQEAAAAAAAAAAAEVRETEDKFRELEALETERKRVEGLRTAGSGLDERDAAAQDKVMLDAGEGA